MKLINDLNQSALNLEDSNLSTETSSKVISVKAVRGTESEEPPYWNVSLSADGRTSTEVKFNISKINTNSQAGCGEDYSGLFLVYIDGELIGDIYLTDDDNSEDSIIIPPGITSFQIYPEIIDDDIYEGVEVLRIQAAVGSQDWVKSYLGSIYDLEDLPLLTSDSICVQNNTSEGGIASWEISMDHASVYPVILDIKIDDAEHQAKINEDYSNIFEVHSARNGEFLQTVELNESNNYTASIEVPAREQSVIVRAQTLENNDQDIVKELNIFAKTTWGGDAGDVNQWVKSSSAMLYKTNDTPELFPDVGMVNEDATLTKTAEEGLLSNDIAGDSLSVTSILSGTSGTPVELVSNGGAQLKNGYGMLTINADGSYRFVADGPDAQALASGDTETVVFTYTAKDGTESLTNTLEITISGTNDVPVLVADMGAVNEDATLTVVAAKGLLSNDTDADSDSLSVTTIQSDTKDEPKGEPIEVCSCGTILTNSYGMLLIYPDGSYSFVANGAETQALGSGETAESVFTYTATDGTMSLTNTLTITITGTNSAPSLVADTSAVNVDASLTIDAERGLLANDSDADGDSLSVIGILSGNSGTPTPVDSENGAVLDNDYGTLTIKADGSYSFVANGSAAQDLAADETAEVVFTYAATDGTVPVINTLTITITVTNHAPVLVADVGDVDECSTLTVEAEKGLLSNDTDAEEDSLSVTTILDPNTNEQVHVCSCGAVITNGYGTLIIKPDGSYSFVADGEDTQNLPKDETAEVEFIYTATDGTSSVTNTLTITITGTNSMPTLVADIGAINADATLTVDAENGVLSNDTDADEDSLIVIGILSGTTGTPVPVHHENGAELVNDYGTLIIMADGSYSFEANGSATQALASGETADVIFTYATTDGKASLNDTLTITFTGND